MADVASAAASTDRAVKPPKPDEEAYNKELAKAEKELKVAQDKLNAVKAKLDLAQPNRNKDSNNPVNKRREELKAELAEIRKKQAVFKTDRASRTDQIKRLDEQLKSRITEQKEARAKLPYKSLDDLERRVEELNRQIESGSLKLIDEKKAVSEQSAAARMRRQFAQFDEGQKVIDDIKAKIKALKDGPADDPKQKEQRELSDKYTVLQKEMDEIKAQSDEAYKNLNSLRDERTKLHAEQNEKWLAVKKIKDDYWSQKRAFNEYEREAKQKARERQRLERERIVMERKKADAERYLEDAKAPAFLEEIRRANSLLQFLDPSAAKPTEKAPLLADSGMAAQAQRKVDDSGLKGMKVLKKDRDEEYLPSSKKGKKGKKQGGAGDSTKFNCPPSVMEDCSFIGVDPPMSQADVAAVVEKVKAKIEDWKTRQESETQKNIEKAKKDLERFEAEEQNGASEEKTAESAAKGETTAEAKD